MRRLIVGLISLLTIAACGSGTDAPNDSGKSPSGAVNAAFIKYTDSLPTVEVTHDGLPKAPKPFDADDVKIFADEVERILQRSVSNDVATLSPGDAVSAVTTEQFDDTIYAMRRDMAEAYGDHHWEWNVASRFDQTQSEPPRIVKVTWKVEARDPEDNDTPDDILYVTLQAHVVQTIGKGKDRNTFLTRRTIGLSGYRPGGGPDWWPYLSMTSHPYGNLACPLYTDALLVPQTDAAAMASDLAGAKVSMAEKSIIDEQWPTVAEVNKRAEGSCA